MCIFLGWTFQIMTYEEREKMKPKIANMVLFAEDTTYKFIWESNSRAMFPYAQTAQHFGWDCYTEVGLPVPITVQAIP